MEKQDKSSDIEQQPPFGDRSIHCTQVSNSSPLGLLSSHMYGHTDISPFNLYTCTVRQTWRFQNISHISWRIYTRTRWSQYTMYMPFFSWCIYRQTDTVVAIYPPFLKHIQRDGQDCRNISRFSPPKPKAIVRRPSVVCRPSVVVNFFNFRLL